MRHLASILAITALLVVAATIGFGWPGWFALTAAAPGLLLGSSIAHAIDALVGIAYLKPMRIVFGITFGSFAAITSLVLMWAATAPPEITIERSASVASTPDLIWPSVSDTTSWTRWDLLVTDLEPLDDGLAIGPPKPGDRFRSSLHIAEGDLPAEHVLVAWEPERRITWRIELSGGAALTELTHELQVTPTDAGSQLTGRLMYRLDSVTARAIHRMTLEGELNDLLSRSVSGLASLIQGTDGR